MSNDLHLDDEAAALHEAIQATPDDSITQEHAAEHNSQSEDTKPKKSNKATKIIIGLGGVLLLSMGGAYVAMESGMLDAPKPKQVRKAPTPPPLTDDATSNQTAQTPTQAPVTSTAPVESPTAGVVATPVASASMQPATAMPNDPFKTADKPAEPIAVTNDPFKTPVAVETPKAPEIVSAPVITKPEPAVKTVVEKVNKPSKQAKNSTLHSAQNTSTQAPVSAKKVIKKSVEPDNGYVRLF